MILNPKESLIAYRCPHCGSTVMSMVGTFALSGDLIKLKCDCKESELIISYTKDDKIRLTVPCLACENPHNYTISASAFFEKDLLELSCKAFGLPICFSGNKDKVFEAIEKADKELEELMGGYSLDDIGKISGNPEGSISDAQISDIVRFMLIEMDDENAIVCKCKHEEGEYDFSISHNKVEVFCTKCGAKETFDLSSTQKASDFLAMDELILK